jgi:hypothetical protein
MAYRGGIDFLELPLGGVLWNTDELHSPWTQTKSDVYDVTNPSANVELRATAREFDIRKDAAHEFMIDYDTPTTDGRQLLCIVMGMRDEYGRPEDARHYVLYITPHGGAANVYERVGVGFMPGKFIRPTGPSGLVIVR